MFWIRRSLEEARYDEALGRCRFLLRWKLAESRLRATLGTVLLMAGRAQEAEHELRRSLAESEGREEAATLWALGSALVALGRKPEGATMYRTALEIDPGMVPVHGDLAALELDCGNLDAARAVLDHAWKVTGEEHGLRRRNPRDFVYVQASRARLLAGNKRFAEASATLENATRQVGRVRSKPARAGGWWRIGQAHLALKNQDQAMLAFENARQVDPDGYYGHLAAGAITASTPVS